MTEVDLDRLLLGVEGLESGEFRQGYDSLCWATAHDGEEYFCCLGVLTEVAIRNGLALKCTVDKGAAKAYDGETSVLPEAVRLWYGFNESNPTLDVLDDHHHHCGGFDCPRACPADCAESHHGTESATTCNDTMRLGFADIAAAFRRTFGLPEREVPEA